VAEPITSFSRQYFFLSNFYRRQFRYNGMTFPTSEHAFQWSKAATVDGALQILDAKTPGDAKKLGKLIIKRPDWETIKVDTMKQILQAKFSIWNQDQITQNQLAQKLVETGNAELVEGNNWGDTFWGQCPLGNGENMLGKLLMKVRSEIRHGF
jgi:ribA/ribD-fused uncharacterized protein